MIIKDLFKKDIERSIQGVVTIGNEDEEQKWQELEEYVCTDEITKAFRTFFRRYRESLSTPTEKMGVWITGYFGSGKSHFLKILGYILENEVVAGEHAIDYFNDKIKDEFVLADIRQCAKTANKVVLFNIDSKAKSDSKNKTQAIMDIMLRAFNEAVGYCGSQPWVADLERTLDAENNLQEFVAKFEQISGRNWNQTRAKALLNRDNIIRSLCAVRGMTEESAKQFVEDQTRNYTNTTEEFAKIVSDYCISNKTRVVFLMDEVGQFIGDNTQLMLNLQTCVEDLGKYCRGQAWVVVTSQQELKAMIDGTKDKQQDFSKIQGRFDLRLLMSGANADEVIKQRLLAKKDNAITPLQSLYEANSSKLANLILFPQKPTWSGYHDADDFKNVYPFVTYQFELLQKVFTAIREHGMSEGKHLAHSERSLLSAFQESAKRVANCEAGLLVPFDSFYQTIEQFIDYDVKTVFANAERRTSLNEFALRVLRVLFMIKHVKEMPATIDRLATLLVEKINEDKAALKEKIYQALKDLEDETLIQRNGDEYDFLTNEEQDVNRQINSTNYNEGEVQRSILDIIYDKVLDSNKFRYENRYEFGLNRFVDSESKGAFNQDFLSIKIITMFSRNLSDSMSLQAESVRTNSIIVDLTEGSFIDELIRANKIATFKRNNSATMSVSLAEIMSKKSAEHSDRKKRAEDIIRQKLRTAPIYFNGQELDIKEKDGKDRLVDALKAMIKQDFYKLGLVSYFYGDQRAVAEVLEQDDIGLFATDDITADANNAAYNEIFERLKNDRQLGRNVTVKNILDIFSKKPFGWRDIDILGMLATLWKRGLIQISIHGVVVDAKNKAFKTDFVRKNGIDTMVVNLKEKIDENILYQVKRIMNDTYSENLPMDETKLKEGVVAFFNNKKSFLDNLRTTHGANYAGASVVPRIYKDFDAITRSTDTLTIFNEIIARKDSLAENAEVLEQLVIFYREGSNQQKTFRDAREIVNWYMKNYMFVDLANLSEIVTQIEEITNMELPFARLNELASLVFQADEIKDKILEEKYQLTNLQLEQDRSTINKELEEALLSNISDAQKKQIKDKADEILKTYDIWLSSLSKDTTKLDSFINSSQTTVSKFRDFVNTVIAQASTPGISTRRMRLIDCIPVASKRITSQADIERVVETIREKLTAELVGFDEIKLD